MTDRKRKDATSGRPSADLASGKAASGHGTHHGTHHHHRTPPSHSNRLTYESVRATIGTRQASLLERKTLPLITKPVESKESADETNIHVVLPTTDNRFDLDVRAMQRVLLDPRVRDRHVAVLSIAGVQRLGKSFILNYLIRYLQSEGTTSWLSRERMLTGFPWAGGTERLTSGIHLWSEPFFCELPSGEMVALLVMDTQGAFSCNTTVMDCTTIFALSFLLSSIQIYNLSSDITERDLEQLQLFAHCGKIAMEKTGIGFKPFQTLQFLVRDWCCPYLYPYGAIGGQMLLEKRIQVVEDLTED